MIKLKSQSKKRALIKSIISKLLLIISLHWSFVSPAMPLINNLREVNHNNKTGKSIRTINKQKNNDNINILSKDSESIFYYPDIQHGFIGTSEKKPIDNPIDNLFVFSIDELPKNQSKVYLEYDLYGVTSSDGISKKINSTQAVGGYLIKRNKKWSSQREELDPSLLKKGKNHLLFGMPQRSNFSYLIKNLRIVVNQNTNSSSKIVIASSTNLLKFGDETYIRGFLGEFPTKNTFGNYKVKVENTTLNLVNNQFEGFVRIPENKNTLDVQLFNDENKLIEQSKLDITAINTAEHKFSFQPKYESVSLSKENQFKSKIVQLYFKNNSNHALITPLRFNDLASLQSGVLNVTDEYEGCNILLQDSLVNEEFSFGIKYNPRAIPKGYSEKDVFTLFFDKNSKSWIPVEKDSININKGIIYSSTKYGSGDYINGVIQTPESPQTNAFTSTKISDIEIANPSSNISIIAAPRPSQTGEANLKYPIKTPTGRKGMSPSVTLSYNSEKQSGIAGYGWDLGFSSININSKWGIPDFDPNNETELYNLDGAQLVYPENFLPHRHSGNAPNNYSITTQARSGSIKEFSLRNQESYVKIERIGTNPTNYYWKVTNTDGKINWYGGDENGLSENTVIRNEDNNIIQWSLKKSIDPFGNNIKYEYKKGTLSNLSGDNQNLNGGHYFYPKRVFYTGYNNQNGNYKIEFNYNENQIKPSITINGRLGLKQVSPYLLSDIQVYYQNQTIRSYELGYIEGNFKKTLLDYVVEKNKNGNEFYRHSFEYYDDIAENGGNLFKPAQTISLPDVDPSYSLSGLAGAINGESIISTNENIQKGFDIRPSAGMEIRIPVHSNNKSRTVTIGADFGENNTKSKGKISLIDMNGDGLDDIVFRNNSGLQFYPNSVNSDNDSNDLINSFENTSKSVHHVNDFYRNDSRTKKMFAESWSVYASGFYAATSRYKTESETSVFFTDGNQDGLIDIVKGNEVYFNYLDENGEPNFTTDSGLTENLVLTSGAPISNWQDPTETQEEEQEELEQEQMQDDFLDFDAVQVWKAPFTGTIQVDNEIKVYIGSSPFNHTIETTSETYSNKPFRIFRDQYSPGVNGEFSLQNYFGNNPPLGVQDLGLGNNSPIKVIKGQEIYFRYHKPNQGYSYYSARPKIYYLNVSDRDENGKKVNEYTYKDYFHLTSNGVIRIPGSGMVNINWPDFSINKPTDDVYVRIYEVSGENENIIYQQYCPAGATTTVSNNLNNQLYQQNDLPLSFKFEVYSDSNVLWEDINWQPVVTYAPDQDAQDNQQVPNVTQEFHPVPDYSIFYASNNKDKYSQDLSNYTNWNNSSQNFGVKPNTEIINSGNLSSSDNGEFLLVVKKGGIPIGKRKVQIKDGQIILPDDSPISVHNGPLGNWSGKIYFSYYVTGNTNKEVYQKYLLSVGNTKGVLLGYNWQGNSLKINAVSYFNDLSNYGSMHGNFGQFYYNDNYDDSNIPEDNIGKLINHDLLVNTSNNYNFDLITINCDEESSDFEDCAQQSIADQMNLPNENTDFSDPNAVEDVINNLEAWMNNNPAGYIPEISFMPANAKSNGTLDEDRWVGIDPENQYFDRITEITIGNIDPSSTGSSGGSSIGSVAGEISDNDTEGPSLPSNNITGMKAIKIKRKSSRRTMSAGYNPLAISSFTPGYSNTLTGFMDWNGDGYPDIWYADNLVLSNMTGGLNNPSGDHNFGVLNSYNNWGIAASATGSDAYTLYSSSSAEGTDASSTKSNKFSIGNATSQIGITVNVAGQNKEEQFFLDLNGDGLPDRIKEINGSYLYQLNKGQHQNNNNFEIFKNLTYSESFPTLTSSSIGGGLSFPSLFPNVGASLNAGISESQTNTKTAFQDINGDGLIDIIESDGNLEGSSSSVKFNYGNKFADQDYSLTAASSIVNLKRNYQDVIIGADGDVGIFFGFPICCWLVPVIHVKFGVNLGGNVSENVTVQTKDFRDLNGDGFADYIVQYSNDEINVNYSAIGRTNKLKSVNNPLGGKVTLDYKAQGKTYNNPKATWVLSKTTLEDGYDLPNTGYSNYSKFYEYENAYYDRRERLSYGFETVKTVEYLADANGDISEDVFRTKVNKFHNQNYFLKGKLKESIVVRGEWDENNPNNIFVRTIHEYGLKEIGNDGLIIVNSDLDENYDVGGTEGRKRAAVLLEKTTTENYELTNSPIVSEIVMEYDGLGRITKYYDNGDVSNTSDNYYSEIGYFENPTLEQNNILNIPTRIQVFDNNGNQKRDRNINEVDVNTGAIKKIGVKLNQQGQWAQTIMDYDQYGNLIEIFYPGNLNGENMSYTYTYDNIEHKFLTEVEDVFGYQSSTEYDYLYDAITKETDISGNEMNYTYDDFGRLSTVLGPKEQEANKPYTIKFDYYPREQDLSQTISIPSGEEFLPVALTSHYDYEHPNNPIKTYTIMDGLGRVRQTKKDVGG